jgi:hypothetical protein
MPNLDFSTLGESEVNWPKRGRKPTPIPDDLIQALHRSAETGSTPHLVIQTNQVKAFAAMLSRAGRKLNYRIERFAEEDKPKKSFTTYHFRAKAKSTDD